MKTAVIPWDSSPYRLLPLLLIVILSVVGVNAVHGSSGTGRKFKIHEDSLVLPHPDVDRFPGKYQLYNRCNSKFVQIRPGGRKGRIDARGKRRHTNTHFIFESYPGGHIYIRGVNRNKYICFNRKGKLILRHTETIECVFKQLPTSDNYTQLQSLINPEWYIGFGKKGRRLKGFAIRNPRKAKCYEYLIMAVTHRRKWSPMTSKYAQKLTNRWKKS